ncbi:MAG: ABC transporter ATP-binding protein [Ruminococcaceae bacterium]|nr:ABC transporter ATP-binding protein [Oscillospiraceae bacterium]
MLEVTDLQVYYGAIHAIKGVSFRVEAGEIVTLIGANGAGKTTILHAISGLVKPRSGEITFQGKNLLTTKPYLITGLGLAQVPEGRRVFARMTVKENLEMGAFARKDRAGISADYDRVMTLLPRLKERRRQVAGTLSGGEQQMLAMGRALMAAPKMLLLDEPSMGLSPLLVGEIFKTIRNINQSGVTILLVEQNARMALELASRAYVLETGKVAMQGSAADLADNEEVRKAYLGG